MRRLPYALAAGAAFLSQHLAAWLIVAVSGRAPRLSPLFWILPWHWAILGGELSDEALLAALLANLAVAAVLVVLTLRRASDARLSRWLALLAVAPVVQPLVILGMSLPPSRPKAEPEAVERVQPGLQTAALAGFAGMGLIAAAVAAGGMALGTYGYGLFIATPVLAGALSGFIANRKGDIGLGATLKIAAAGQVFGAFALLGLAIEGVICLIMAAPIIIPMALLGAWVGRSAALAGKPSLKQPMMAVLILPAVFAAERASLTPAAFQTEESVEVAAPPEAVWRALVRMGPITGEPDLPFRLGLAYPVDGHIQGQGVGAIREGVFSTGVAYERVTAWEPGRKLAFDVLSDPPSMRELSPYAEVHAPHVKSAFHTRWAAFTIAPLPGGRSRLSLRTAHDLALEPAAYWLPIARWAIHSNKQRVLEHFRRAAELMPAQTTSAPQG